MNRFLKIHCLVVLAMALLFANAAPVLAEETHGNIAWIEPDDHTFTLVDGDNNVLTMRFQVGGEVLMNDQESTIWDLLPGDHVTVTFDRASDGLTATRIECRRVN